MQNARAAEVPTNFFQYTTLAMKFGFAHAEEGGHKSSSTMDRKDAVWSLGSSFAVFLQSIVVGPDL